jgi:hypothetical protein
MTPLRHLYPFIPCPIRGACIPCPRQVGSQLPCACYEDYWPREFGTLEQIKVPQSTLKQGVE